MARTDTFEVEGLVVAVLSDRTYRVELANGHRLLGFVPGPTRPGQAAFGLGAKVQLALSPYDLSEGRIIVEKQKI